MTVPELDHPSLNGENVFYLNNDSGELDRVIRMPETIVRSEEEFNNARNEVIGIGGLPLPVAVFFVETHPYRILPRKRRSQPAGFGT